MSRAPALHSLRLHVLAQPGGAVEIEASDLDDAELERVWVFVRWLAERAKRKRRG